MGECLISNRKKSEPFNPFAPNAAQERKRRQESRPPQLKRPEQRIPQSPVEPNQKTLQERQAESKQQLQEQGDVTQTKFVESPATVVPKTQQFPKHKEKEEDSRRPKILTTEERRAKLAEQSKTLKKEVQVITEVSKNEVVKVESKLDKLNGQVRKVASIEDGLSLDEDVDFDDEFEDGKKRRKTSRKDVFKKIETKVVEATDKRRPKRRHEQRGGGSQKKEKKLDSKRSIEYRFAARDILDKPSVADIHRSNILGQVWAKGERMGIDVAIAFIDEKINEGILSQEIGQQMKTLVKEMTTRR
ncbi:MAG: hypothetical protein O3B67_01185 [archaeon]|nr:hypothetical protein [archaeon]